MSSRQRLLEILTQSGLIDRDLEAERIRAQRDVARTSAASALLGNLVPQVVGAASSAYGAASKARQADAVDFVASQAGKVGDLKEPERQVVLDPMVEFKPKAPEFVTKREPTGNTLLDTIYGLPLRPPLAGARAPEGPPVPVSPYAPPAYLRTPGEQAAADVEGNPDLAKRKPTGNILLDTFSSLAEKARDDAAAHARAARTQQITADRAAADALQVEQQKAADAARHQQFGERLDAGKFQQSDQHFTEGQALTREQGDLNRKAADARGAGHDAAVRSLAADKPPALGVQRLVQHIAIAKQMIDETRSLLKQSESLVGPIAGIVTRYPTIQALIQDKSGGSLPLRSLWAKVTELSRNIEQDVVTGALSNYAANQLRRTQPNESDPPSVIARFIDDYEKQIDLRAEQLGILNSRSNPVRDALDAGAVPGVPAGTVDPNQDNEDDPYGQFRGGGQ